MKWNIFILFIILTIIVSQYEKIFSQPLGLIGVILLIFQVMFYVDSKLGIITFIILLLLYIMFFLKKKNNKEGFTWSRETINKFNNFEKVNNPHMIFDLKEMQQQASEEEVNTLIKTGMWPWTQSIEKIFLEEISKNSYIRANPQHMLNKSRSIFPEAAIKKLLSWNTSEGKLLFHGMLVDNDATKESSNESTYGVNSGLVGQNKDTIKCSNSLHAPSSMIRIHKTGTNGIYNTETTETSPIDYSDLPNIINGFSFVKSPCNPCVALNSPSDYTCPFSLDNKISPIWENLWGLTGNVGADPKKFPELAKLKNELNSLFINSTKI